MAIDQMMPTQDALASSGASHSYRMRRRERFRRVLGCFEFADFAGKRVLEIAGDDTEVAEYFLSLGAASVTIINLSQFYLDGEVKPNIFFRRVDARQLKTEFGLGAFDIIFGVAILEHLHDIGDALAECKAVLSPGGLLYISGYALWSSSIGHHVWVNVQGSPYRFSDATNPIPPHGHLLLGKDGLSEYLRNKKGIPAEHIEAINDLVFHSDVINRYGFSKIQRAFHESGLNIAEAGVLREAVPGERLDHLRSLDADEDYSALGVTFSAFHGEGARLRRPVQAKLQAYKHAPEKAEWALCYAEVLFSWKRLDEAEAAATAALNLDGDLVKAYELLSQILLEKGSSNGASHVLGLAMNRWPHDPMLRAKIDQLQHS